MTTPPPVAVMRAMPHRGPCGFCGGPDARHRVWDAIVERVRVGEPPEAIADDYEQPLNVVHAVIARWDDHAQEWRP